MIIHPIHGLDQPNVIKILERGLSSVKEEASIKNYHPDFKDHPSNIFFVLKEGRYAEKMGTYFVIEEDDKYICSAGWNKYIYVESTALLLTRMYVHADYRRNYVVGEHILPICIGESQIKHKILWMTFHQDYRKAYLWFAKMRRNTTVPSAWRKFNYIGLKKIYNTPQHVYQYHLSVLR